MGNALALQGKWEQARKLYLDANDLFQTLDDTLAISHCYANMGEIALAQHDFLQAEICYAQALSLRENVQDTDTALQTYVHLAVVRIEQGEFAKAEERLTRTLKRGQQLGAMQGTADAVEGFALLACRTGDFFRSAILFGCAAQLRAFFGLPVPAPTCQTFEVCFQILCQTLGEEDFQRYRQQGRAYSVEQVYAYALEQEKKNR